MSGVCTASFLIVPASKIGIFKSRVVSAASQAGVRVDFKQRDVSNGIELGVRLCGNSYADIMRANSYINPGQSSSTSGPIQYF